MTNLFSLPRAAGTALLTAIPLFAVSAASAQTKPVVPAPASSETTKLKLIASSFTGKAPVGIATDVVGLTNCRKTAEAFAETQGIWGTDNIRAVCTPAEGGAPIAKFRCTNRDDVITCRTVEHF